MEIIRVWHQQWGWGYTCNGDLAVLTKKWNIDGEDVFFLVKLH